MRNANVSFSNTNSSTPVENNSTKNLAKRKFEMDAETTTEEEELALEL